MDLYNVWSDQPTRMNVFCNMISRFPSGNHGAVKALAHRMPCAYAITYVYCSAMPSVQICLRLQSRAPGALAGQAASLPAYICSQLASQPASQTAGKPHDDKMMVKPNPKQESTQANPLFSDSFLSSICRVFVAAPVQGFLVKIKRC